MEIPPYFAEAAGRQFGQKGPAWVRQLPSLLARCQAKWDLQHITPAEGLSINLVCFASSPTYGDVILKLQGPHDERYTEMLALARFDGRFVCTCLESDYEMAAMLLERLAPGHDLWSITDRQRQLDIGSQLIAQLPLLLEDTQGFPHYTDWMRRAFEITLDQYNASAGMRALIAAANELVADTDPATWPDVLLHGDLHHANILSTGRDTWKAIDPQGVIGPPYFEPARFIQNHIFRPGENDPDQAQLDHAVTHFANVMGETKGHIATGLFLLHLLSTCWDYEANEPAESIEQQLGQCRWLLKYALTYSSDVET